MKSQHVINIILFFLLSCMVIIASKGGFSNNTLWSDIFFNIGISMLGGVICGIALYGISIFQFEKNDRNKFFTRINRNCDMGEQYWINLISDLEKNGFPLWFVGSHHLTWIDRGLPYQTTLREKIIQRINAFSALSGGEIIIILANKDAYNKWKEFMSEIAKTTNYWIRRPELIKIGFADQFHVPYSIVAHSRCLVITPYTSSGRSADSPTFEVKPDSPVANLYLKDLERIKSSITSENWWCYQA